MKNLKSEVVKLDNSKPKTLKVVAYCRYPYEDASYNGVVLDEMEKELTVPGLDGNVLTWHIDLDTGEVEEFKEFNYSKEFTVWYKIVDEGNYYLLDKNNKVCKSIENDYVIDSLQIDGDGYGDYMVLTIKNGIVQNWNGDMVIQDFY